MNALKEHLRHIYKAFFQYRRGFLYLYMRYWVAPKILHYKKPLERPITHQNLSVHMLLGARDFLMALWSLASFYHSSRVIGALYIHSDGTLTEKHRVILARLFPSAQYIDARDVLANHAQFFEAHPVLEEFRRTYTKFQAKKLLDPYLSSDREFRLILDSDMLWFKNPDEIEHNLSLPNPRALMMSDGDGDFAYVEFKDGTRISPEIASFNSGITLYRKDQLDLAALERYISSVDYLHTRFTDQACYATVLKEYLDMLPKDRYILKGPLGEFRVMRHYTGPQRAKFYLLGLDRMWKNLLN